MAQLLSKHLLSDCRDVPAQLAKTQLVVLEPPEDQDFPPARDHVEDVLDGATPVLPSGLQKPYVFRNEFAEVVLADGSVVSCDANRDPDLFWAPK